METREDEPLKGGRRPIKRSYILIFIAIIAALVALYYSNKSTGAIKSEKLQQKNEVLENALKRLPADSSESPGQ